MVTMRSFSEMKLDSALSSVVLPAPVPPDTITFRRAPTTDLQEVEHRLRQALTPDEVLLRRSGRSGTGGWTGRGHRARAAG